MTLGSLFDGVGGWQCAAVKAGIKSLWSSEIDEFCMSVTRRHFPDTVQLGDINLIEDAPPKYSLSPRACRGILRRAKNHNKQLPPELEKILIAQSATTTGKTAESNA